MNVTDSPLNFDILVSDTWDFKNPTTLYSKNSDNTWEMRERFQVYTKTNKPYRYIRIKKKDNTFFELSEISVYGYKK